MISIWADKIINIYFKQRPADITQKIYKKYGFKPFEYWYYELLYILNMETIWHTDEEYLKNKYGSDSISFINFDSNDRQLLLTSFYKYLGIEKDMFPYNESDIPKLII